MDLEGLRECALLLEEEDMLMEPSAKPEFLVEDIMPERDRFMVGVGVVVVVWYFVVLVVCFGWCFKRNQNLCGMFLGVGMCFNEEM